MKSKKSYYESAKDEVDLLESLREVEKGYDPSHACQEKWRNYPFKLF